MIQFIHEIDIDRWNALVEKSPVATWFQTPECAQFFKSLPEMMTEFEYGVLENGELKAVMVGYLTKETNPVKQLLSRRAVVIGGPLLSEDISEEALMVLLNGTAREQKNAIFIETRNFNDYSGWKKAFEGCGWNYEEHFNFHIDTSRPDIVEDHMGKSRKRDAMSTLRHGAEMIDKPSESEIVEFYHLLRKLYSTKVKTPLFPLEFFLHLSEVADSRFILVRYQGDVIGGTVCVSLEGKAVYEWFACGEDGLGSGIHPSTLATFSAINMSAESGFPRFDMMGAGSPGDGGYGVRDFKAKFGGTLVEHGRFKKINSGFFYHLGELGVKILKKI